MAQTRDLTVGLRKRQAVIVTTEPEGRAPQQRRRLLELDRLTALLKGGALRGRTRGREVGVVAWDQLKVDHPLQRVWPRTTVARLAGRDRLERSLRDRDLLRPFVVFSVGDVRQQLAVDRQPDHGLTVDRVLAGDA